jgi:hypothetical protein
MRGATTTRARIPARQGRRAALAVGLLATAVVWAAAGPVSAAGTTVGNWPMHETSGSVMGDVSGSLDGTIGAAVMLGDPQGYLFPGWTGNIDGTGNLSGKVSASAGAVSVPDPADMLDPRTGNITVSLLVRATRTASGRLPTASGASYNIVQKARADDPGGFWKLELAGSGTASGKLRWALSDGTHKVVVASKKRIDDGASHTVVAERRGGQTVLTVDGVSATASASSVGDIHPTGKWSETMTVGKKPGSTDPKDAFAGYLQQLVVSR